MGDDRDYDYGLVPPVLGKADSGVFPGSYRRMTLRDYFAALAMQGLCASFDYDSGDQFEDIPTDAYRIADLMLKARET